MRERLRALAIEADARATTELVLARLWRDLARGLSTTIDAFFSKERCYLILADQLPGSAQPLEARRLEIIEAILGGSRQKNIAIDLNVAPSTVALKSKCALESLGAIGKPSRSHPLLMLAARAAAEGEDWTARVANFLIYDERKLRVVSIPHPECQLADSLPTAEREVSRRLIEGFSYKQMSEERGTSVRTIANQVSAVFGRLGVSGRNELVQHLLSASCPQTLPPPASSPQPLTPPAQADGVADSVRDLPSEARRSA
ncbi:MAG TPA: helix-turn-helix transcriptional regulator [Polyangiaceae bacterium]|jgi:DNA-binding NarL/FixJ family response regulator